MATLVYENSKGIRIELGNNKPIVLEKIEGISSLKNNISTIISNNNDGVNIVNSRLESRDISIQFAIINKEVLVNEKIRADILTIFNPKLNGKLIYKNEIIERSIDVIIETTPNFTKAMKGAIQRCVVDFIAPCPYWTSIEQTGTEIVTWIGGLSFPFSFPVSFATKGENNKNIINDGDVETPLEIIFKGPAINPKVSNILTGEFIRIKKTLSSDDTLVINTAYGDKKVEIIKSDGFRQNAFNYIDLNSTFFQLNQGDNILEYGTDGLEPSSVAIKFKKRYLGV